MMLISVELLMMLFILLFIHRCEADETRPCIVTGNKQKNEQHHQQFHADQHHADAHARFERRVINRIRLAAQAGECRARIRKRVHANPEPRHA